MGVPLEQRTLSASTRSDVVRNFRSTDDLTGGIAYRRDRQGDVQLLAILVHADGFVAFDPFSPADLGQDFDLLVLEVRRNDAGNGFADHFRRGEPEQALGCDVPGGDNPLERLADNSVLRGHDDRREECAGAVSFSGAEVPFGSDSHSHQSLF